MTRTTPYRFHLAFGLQGCYMPDSVQPCEASSRRELMDIIRTELDAAGWPKSKLAEFNLREVWRHVQRIKSGSSVHTAAYHGANAITLSGMTDAEWEEATRDED